MPTDIITSSLAENSASKSLFFCPHGRIITFTTDLRSPAICFVCDPNRPVNLTLAFEKVTGQFADKPTRDQSSRGLVSSRTSQLAEMFDLNFGVYNSSKC